MAIHVRRYHFALVFLLLSGLSVIGVLTLSREKHPRKSAAPDMPPMQEIVLEDRKPAPRPRPAEPVRKPVSKPAITPAQSSSPGAPAVKRAALTFDDGPHPGFTDRLIQTLGDNGVHATFFVVGKQAALHPNLVEKIFEAGHELANHSYTHRDLRTLQDRDLSEELDKTHRLVESITDQKMRFFRPPGGQYNERVIKEATDLNYTMALWTVLPSDHAQPPASVIVDKVVKGVKDNAIILLHSGVENTLTALPEIISVLKAEGYVFVTLSELSAQSGIPSLVRAVKE